jgi:hypothetical protein
VDGTAAAGQLLPVSCCATAADLHKQALTCTSKVIDKQFCLGQVVIDKQPLTK